MKIAINNKRKIYAIQEEFNAVFPHLKLVFHAKPSKSGAAPSEKLVSHESKILQECRAIHNEGTVEILPTMNISGVKNVFRDIFGLSVEILQRGENGQMIKPANESLTLEATGRQPLPEAVSLVN